MATSTIHSTITSLVSGLQARANLRKDGVQVSDGFPLEPQQEMIAVGGATGWNMSWVAMNPATRPVEEEFVLELHIRVIRGRGSAAQARERAFVLLQEVEDMLRDDPEISASVYIGRVSGGAYVNAQSGQNTEARLEMSVECKARI